RLAPISFVLLLPMTRRPPPASRPRWFSRSTAPALDAAVATANHAAHGGSTLRRRVAVEGCAPLDHVEPERPGVGVEVGPRDLRLRGAAVSEEAIVELPERAVA